MKQRTKKKLVKKSVIIYDLESLPREATIKMVVDIAKNHNLLLWDSSKNGEEPRIYPTKNKVLFKIEDKAI